MYFSKLKPNLAKSEIADIEILKVVQVAVCGMCCIDLNNNYVKIVFPSFITTVPKYIVNENEKNTKAILWKNSTPKIKHEILCNYCKAGGSKNVDVLSKIIVLQWSWTRRLYNNSFHEWKFISLYLIEKSFATSFKLHSNLLFKSNKAKFFHLSVGKLL